MDRPPDPTHWGEARPGSIARSIIGLSRRSPFGRGGMRRQMFNALRHLHADAVDTHLWGAPVRLHPWNNACERKALMRPDRMDALEHGIVERTVAARACVFVDVGANAGLYSLHAALSSHPGGRILAIEPNAELLGRLRFNLRLARQAGLIADDVRVEMVEAALSDFDGEGAMSNTGTEGTRRLESPGAGRPVAVRRLDAVLRERGIAHVDILKIDVEGGEDRIVMPFLETTPASSWPLVIVIEHLSRATWRKDCIEACCARGYGVAATTRNNTVLERTAPPREL